MIQKKRTKEKFEINLPFSLMEAFSSIPVGYISRNKLNTKQRLAHAKLCNHLSKFMQKKINRTTYLSQFVKSKIAYRMEMRCKKSICAFSWTIIFDIRRKKSFLYKKF